MLYFLNKLDILFIKKIKNIESLGDLFVIFDQIDK